jgi:hypothetical protein
MLTYDDYCLLFSIQLPFLLLTSNVLRLHESDVSSDRAMYEMIINLLRAEKVVLLFKKSHISQ